MKPLQRALDNCDCPYLLDMAATSGHDVARLLTKEPKRLLNEALPTAKGTVKLEAPHEALLNTEIVVEVDISRKVRWSDILSAFAPAAALSNMIHGHWTSGDELHVVMGLDVWRSTRLDRFTGSRIVSLANND